MKTSPTTSRWSDQLRQRSYKATPSRVAILETLARAKRPLSVQAIAKKTTQVDQATIYRTLNTLKKINLVRQIDFQHGHAHFELSAWGDHHHVICRRCGRVEDIHDCNLRQMTIEALQQSGFASITEHTLEFFGICKQCRK